ncbi:MAG: DUF1501 domain-containing protein [bacterium]|nr:DUF1501 domain-containing protein [bacterium]
MNDDRQTTRRDFLGRGLTLLGASATVPLFLHRTARALVQPGDTSGDHRILVVVQLAGGNDGLNTVVPYRNDRYYKLRPKLANAAGSVLKIDDAFGFHPAATGLKSLYDQGRLAILHGLGYPNPNRSHFKSTDVWETASPDTRAHYGWIGRYFDACCAGEDPSAGIALTAEAPLAMRGRRFTPVAFEQPDALTLRAARDPRMATALADLNEPAGPQQGRPLTTLDFLRRTALDARTSADRIRRAASNKRTGVGFPNNALGNSLQTVARLITAKMPTRVYYVSLAGFDTHSGQLNRHKQLMTELGSALAAFIKALDKQGDLDQTLLMTFTEFGRRVAENASGGTDHGEAGPMFLAGSRIAPGFHGTMPSLDKLNRGDLAYTLDFRRVYATILSDWLGADAAGLLGGPDQPLPLIKT